jgi:hypothetical protein
MKRKILLVCAMTVIMASPSLALEFQQMGNFVLVGGSTSYKIDDNLAGTVNRLPSLIDPTTGWLDLAADTTTSIDRAGQAVHRIGTTGKMQQSGNNSHHLNGDAILGVRLRHFTTGIFGTL